MQFKILIQGKLKKSEKHPSRSVTFSKVATLLNVTLLHGC